MKNVLNENQEKELFNILRVAYENFTWQYKQELYEDFGIDCAYDYMEYVLHCLDELEELNF